ncbi:MAG: Gfo/Idh/MocA family protein [Lachnospiraceae bacterium]
MLKVGMIGTGRIAERFLAELAAVEGITAVCVYNPNLASAKRFAWSGNIPSYTDQLDDLAKFSDAVYIASPHETHYEYARALLGRKKHVLCEKPLALKRNHARELFCLAKDNDCVLMEAIKTAWCPGFKAMMETATSGIIGEVRDVEACFTKLTPANARELTDRDYGGSFMELGTYVMLPIMQLLGTEFDGIQFRSLRTENGLDGYTKAEFIYPEACGLAKAGLLAKSEGQLIIAGTKGYILAKSPWWLTREFEVRFEDASRQQTHSFEFAGAGLRYEIAAFAEAVQGERKLARASEMSIRMAAVMEQFMELEKAKRKCTETVSFGMREMEQW